MAFKDILGHDSPIGTLRREINLRQEGGVYLFAGPEGIGKSLVARAFAKTMNCDNPVMAPAMKKDRAGLWRTDCCDACPSCVKIEKNIHPDIHILDYGDDQIKIEFIRELKEVISLKPFEAAMKFFIILNAHQLNAESSNALLKTLEEPPGNSVVILVTHKPAQLLDTVRSRCKRIAFQALSSEALTDILRNRYGFSDEDARFLAYFCGGCLGEAVARKDTDVRLHKNQMLDVFLRSGTVKYDNDSKRAMLKDQLNMLVSWLRDIYVLKAGLAESGVIHQDRIGELQESAGRLSWQGLDRVYETACEALGYVEHNVNVNLLLSHVRTALQNEAGVRA